MYIKSVSLIAFLVGASALGYVYLGANEPQGATTEVTNTANQSFSSREMGFEPADEEGVNIGFNDRYSLDELRDWERPSGPMRVGLQVGHLRNSEVPEELSNLRRNGGGAVWGLYNERDTVEVIARLAADRLREQGIRVDILPATVEPGYVADAFVSIHADGNTDERVRGYKVAHFSHDFSGLSEFLEEEIEGSYEAATGLPEDENVTYYMTGYYAFNWWRYEHAVHPMTPAVILETGFLTNASDRTILIDNPAQAAQGIADGVISFLESNAGAMAEQKMIDLPEAPFAGEYRCLEGELDPNDSPDELDVCRAGIQVSEEERYGFIFESTDVSEGDISTEEGEQVRVNGVYVPMVELRDLSWYNYDVEGVIEVESVEVISD